MSFFFSSSLRRTCMLETSEQVCSIQRKHKGLFHQWEHAGGGDQWINTKEEEATLRFQHLHQSHTGLVVWEGKRTCLLDGLGKKKMHLRRVVWFYRAFGQTAQYRFAYIRSFCCFCWVSYEMKRSISELPDLPVTIFRCSGSSHHFANDVLQL